MALSPDLETLLQIWGLGFELGDFGFVGERGGFFASVGCIASICERGRPGQGLFLRGWTSEKFGGSGEGVRESGDGNRVVGEVDETCGAETMEDRFCGLETLGGGAGEEVCEIYYLEGGLGWLAWLRV